ncbi:DNA starvation/stationary phase protection protein [Rubinisphaera sp.]|uniref:Dps family protein n=1 Tax=Rubinisphaera sp. TaxID=2024857 RepID=UPI0025E9B6A4|nr:DNA starvation/stationary phase protection protein [Rubinisphaera sp.]|tara:strand:+ start:845 stop:1318 length:474 start_codon:yes stop_codon:yes gene_type:complete
MTEFKRQVLPEEKNAQVAETLQDRLVDLIDLALQLKQAHWCVVGNNFRAVHLQLDEIINDVRLGSDEVAERMSTLGVAPDGRAIQVAEGTSLALMDKEFASAASTVSLVADRLQTTVRGLRESIELLGDLDPISEDLLISMTAGLEKHLWMVQSQEV